MTFKKQNLSLILGILLIMLMYKTPQVLKNFSNQVMGKLILVTLLVYFALGCDLACAIIFAAIIIVLLHDSREGFKEGKFMGGQLEKLYKKSQKNANNAEKKLGFKIREGMKEGGPDDDDHDHEDHHDDTKKKKKKKKEEEDDDDDDSDDEGMMNDSEDPQEGFIGLNNMKNVTNKLQNYLGFSITDLDRFMKTSSEKNTIASTKDH